MLLDLSAAFDTVDRCISLNHLEFLVQYLGGFILIHRKGLLLLSLERDVTINESNVWGTSGVCPQASFFVHVTLGICHLRA